MVPSKTRKEIAMTEYVYNDGGRAAAGRKGDAGDCVCRAIAITTGLPYMDVYNRLAEGCANEMHTKHSKRGKGVRTASNGVFTHRKWFKDYMEELGFVWTPTMSIGSGCQVHLRGDELPSGRIIVSVTKHVAAVIDGVLNDTFDCSREGTRCVYGYWKLPA